MQNQWTSTWVGASWAMLAQDDTSLKPSWRKMTERIDFSLIFQPFWDTKIIQKSMKKWIDFQTPYKTVFSAQEDPKGSKIELENTSKIKLFLESKKTTESCSRLHADLVFEVWRVPKSHFFWNPFRKPSSCCTGTLVFQIFDKNDAPESVQNRSKILPKMKQETKWKKHVKSGGGPPQIKVGGEGAAPCGG